MPNFVRSHIRRPAVAAQSFTAVEVASAYNYPTGVTGRGYVCALIELGGGFSLPDLTAYFSRLGIKVPNVVSVPVAGGANKSDGPNGADGEVLLDIEVAAAVAPGALFRVYFAPNTDAGFLQAINRAIGDLEAGDAISISWGGPETSWDPATIDAFDAAFKTARAKGINVFVAAGDSGADDGTGSPVVDFPASSPNVVGCGGTRLVVSNGQRQSETVWDDNASSSATGGGVSTHFPGRCVPDVAGNADPATGYQVVVDSGGYVIGGTSAVAPLYAGLALLISEALQGERVDFLTVIPANPQVCFDVTSGNNGAFRAGPGRDQTTGFGVVDGTKLLDALQASAPPAGGSSSADANVVAFYDVAADWARARHVGVNKTAALAAQKLFAAEGLST